MKNRRSLQKSGHSYFLCVQKETFTVGDTRLSVEDRIPVFAPWRGVRILRIPGTNAFYSAVPLWPTRHRLLCYNYCEDALQQQEPSSFKHALVLGCGGGAVPKWLLEKYRFVSVDVVDYSETIIANCKKYFLKRWAHSERLHFYCADARDYDPPGYRYQFIFCDLFDGSELAPFVYSSEFAKKVRGMIRDDGLLVINCGCDHQSDVLMMYQTVFQYLRIVERKAWQTKVIKASDRAFKTKPRV